MLETFFYTSTRDKLFFCLCQRGEFFVVSFVRKLPISALTTFLILDLWKPFYHYSFDSNADPQIFFSVIGSLLM